MIQPPVDVAFYTPDAAPGPRDDWYLVVSALVPYKKIDQAVAACTQSGRRLIVIGEGPERARLEAMAGPTVRFLGWQTDEVIRAHYRQCRALSVPRRGGFWDRSDRGPRVRRARDRAQSRRRGRDRRQFRGQDSTMRRLQPHWPLRSIAGKPRAALTTRPRRAAAPNRCLCRFSASGCSSSWRRLLRREHVTGRPLPRTYGK